MNDREPIDLTHIPDGYERTDPSIDTSLKYVVTTYDKGIALYASDSEAETLAYLDYHENADEGFCGTVVVSVEGEQYDGYEWYDWHKQYVKHGNEFWRAIARRVKGE